MSQIMNLDFGFNSEEFKGSIETIPYAQFINPVRSSNWGIGIKTDIAEMADFNIIKGWDIVEHEFDDGNKTNLIISQSPRVLVLHRSPALMASGKIVKPYNREFYTEANEKARNDDEKWKAFSYLVVFFVDENNNLLSETPFRLRCSGQAGASFTKNYSNWNNQQSFCYTFLKVYQQLTGDRTAKNQLFYSHCVYVPTLAKDKAVHGITGKSSWACLTKGFLEPTEKNIKSLIILNNSETSQKIKESIELSKDWFRLNPVEVEQTSEETPSVDRDTPAIENTENDLSEIPF